MMLLLCCEGRYASTSRLTAFRRFTRGTRVPCLSNLEEQTFSCEKRLSCLRGIPLLQLFGTAHYDGIRLFVEEGLQSGEHARITLLTHEVENGTTSYLFTSIRQSRLDQRSDDVRIQRTGFATLAGDRMHGTAPHRLLTVMMHYIETFDATVVRKAIQ